MTIEDQLREAGRAVTEQIRELPGLTLPPAGQGARSGARRRRRLLRPARSGWLIPLTAAAAVIAVAGTLVATRTLHVSTSPAASQTAPATGWPSGVPRYLVALGTLNLQGMPTTADVVDSRTGKLLARVSAPADGTFAEVGGGGDDRTFVLADLLPKTPHAEFDMYLLRLVPGAAHPAQLTKLPIKTVTGAPVGFAVAPDDRELAVASAFSNTLTLRVYSLQSATVLGTWTTHGNAVGYLGVTAIGFGLSWLADGRRVSFSILQEPGFAGDPTDVRTLSVTEPSGDLLADSRLALRIPGIHTASEAGSACLDTLLTPDGRTVICGGYSGPGCVKGATELVAYSVATGKLARVLYPGKCGEVFQVLPLWVNESARDVTALVENALSGSEKRQIGVIAHGRFTGTSYPFLSGIPFAVNDIAF